jgi:tight adherence protein B
MGELLAAVGLLCASAIIAYLWRNARLQNLSRRRFESTLRAFESDEFSQAELPPAQPLLRRHRLLPWLVGAATWGMLSFVVGLLEIYSVTVGLVVGLLLWQVEVMLADRRVHRVETQLADAIDLMVGSLRAGAGMLNALESAVRESHPPLKEQLDEMSGRIRFGDDPQTVFRSLPQRVPLETFLLFSSALSVNWEVGGSLASTLATVGRTIRDRIEISRRIRSMSAQVRVSILSVLGLTYFIGAIMWFNDPDRMNLFLKTGMGSFLVAGAIMLQAVGIVWASSLSRSRV